MEITHGRDMDYASDGFKHGSMGVGFKFLSHGVEHTPENYVLLLAKQANYHSPVHMHNFDKFRVTLQGDISLTPGLYLKEGHVSYLPEGVKYGPQDDGPGERIVLGLQFGGASGQGFMSLETLKKASLELRKTGEFRGGKYYPADGGEVVDWYQANWEYINKRPLVYPKGRYHAPICMDPESFSWKATPTQGANSFKKLLGTYSERESSIEYLKIEGAGSLRIGGDDAIHLAFVTDGCCKIDEEELTKESVVKTPAGVATEVVSETGLEMIHFVMPMMSQPQPQTYGQATTNETTTHQERSTEDGPVRRNDDIFSSACSADEYRRKVCETM